MNCSSGAVVDLYRSKHLPVPFPLPSVHSRTASWLAHACSCLRVLIEAQPQLLLKESGARVAPLLSQRLPSALLPKLRAAYDTAGPTSVARRTCLHAIVHVLLSAPVDILPRFGSLAPLVSLWVHLVASSACADPTTSTTTSTAATASTSTPAASATTSTPFTPAATASASSASFMGGAAAVALLDPVLALLLALLAAYGAAGVNGGVDASPDTSLAEAVPTALKIGCSAAADALPLSALGHVQLLERCLQVYICVCVCMCMICVCRYVYVHLSIYYT